jgi:nitrite reductase/ring-hydroxylating ferredoxin subunit
MGREIVLFRTRSGRLVVADAYCPHLGTDLGRGGTVCDELLRCPMHGFTFDAHGRCTSTPYGRPPPSAQLDVLEVAEVSGVVIAYHDSSGSPATWRVEVPESDASWRPLRTRMWRLRGHPQEVTENSVDLGHFAVLHRFDDQQILEPLTTDGPRLRTAYSIRRPIPFRSHGLLTEFSVSADGLGFSFVKVRVPDLGWETRQFVLPTPVDETTIDLRVALSLRTGQGVGPLTPAFDSRPAAALAERLMMAAIAVELRRDMAIWRYKRYLPRPALASGDGPIGQYRRWARQFYSPGDIEREAPHDSPAS